MRMMYYSVMTQANPEKEIPSAPIRSRTKDLPITSSDAVPLSYRRLMGAMIFFLSTFGTNKFDNLKTKCTSSNLKRGSRPLETVPLDYFATASEALFYSVHFCLSSAFNFSQCITMFNRHIDMIIQ